MTLYRVTARWNPRYATTPTIDFLVVEAGTDDEALALASSAYDTTEIVPPGDFDVIPLIGSNHIWHVYTLHPSIEEGVAAGRSAAAAILGATTSPRKASTSAANGRRGGRPRSMGTMGTASSQR